MKKKEEKRKSIETIVKKMENNDDISVKKLLKIDRRLQGLRDWKGELQVTRFIRRTIFNTLYPCYQDPI